MHPLCTTHCSTPQPFFPRSLSAPQPRATSLLAISNDPIPVPSHSPKIHAHHFLNCTKNTELTSPHFARTFTLASRHQLNGQSSYHHIVTAMPKSFGSRIASAIRKAPSNPIAPFRRLNLSPRLQNPKTLSRQPLLHNCECPMNFDCGKKIHHPRIYPVIVEDTTCCVSPLTGTISGSNFAIP